MALLAPRDCIFSTAGSAKAPGLGFSNFDIPAEVLASGAQAAAEAPGMAAVGAPAGFLAPAPAPGLKSSSASPSTHGSHNHSDCKLVTVAAASSSAGLVLLQAALNTLHILCRAPFIEIRSLLQDLLHCWMPCAPSGSQAKLLHRPQRHTFRSRVHLPLLGELRTSSHQVTAQPFPYKIICPICQDLAR